MDKKEIVENLIKITRRKLDLYLEAGRNEEGLTEDHKVRLKSIHAQIKLLEDLLDELG
tara:strand:- start:79 stop:252 length:174 start_codon:yes stop_codon:yes gene_type:complete